MFASSFTVLPAQRETAHSFTSRKSIREVPRGTKAKRQGSDVTRTFVCSAVKPSFSVENDEAAGSWTFPPSLLSAPLPKPALDWFVNEAVDASLAAVDGGMKRFQIVVLVPELDPSVDVYSLRSVLTLAWNVVFAFANSGKRVKVCIQGSGTEKFGGMPLSVAGIRRAIERDMQASQEAWSTVLENVVVGETGAGAVDDEDDIFFLVSPTNTIGQPVIEDVIKMEERIGDRPMIMLNARLGDVASYEGIMGVQGRQERMAFVSSFDFAYHFRLLYAAATDYPIRGALYRKYPGDWQIYEKEVNVEEYRLINELESKPSRDQLASTFQRQSSSSTFNASDPAVLLTLVASLVGAIGLLAAFASTNPTALP